MKVNIKTGIRIVLTGALAMLIVLAMSLAKPVVPEVNAADPSAAGTDGDMDAFVMDLDDVFKNTANTDNTQRIINTNDKAWYVIGYDGNGVASAEGTMTLFSRENLPNNFDTTGYNGDNSSNIYNGYFLNEVNSMFAAYPDENARVTARTLTHGNYAGIDTDCIAGDDDLDNQKFWLLSTKEANALNMRLRGTPEESGAVNDGYKNWWLRSPGVSNNAAYVDKDGNVNYEGIDVVSENKQFGCRPAYHIDLNDILFVCPANSNETKQFVGDDHKLIKAGKNSTGEWKLTLKEPVKSTSDFSSMVDFRVEDVELCEGSDTMIQFKYYDWGYDSSGYPEKPSQVSGMIKDSNGKITHYGMIKYNNSRPTQNGDTATLELDGTFNEGDHLYIFNEYWNGINKSDIAGELHEITLPEGFGHDWEFVDFTWTGDDVNGYSAAKANYKCSKYSSHKKSVNVEVSSSTTEATCTTGSEKQYTAEIPASDSPDGVKHTDSKTVTGAALGHNMTEHPAVAATCMADGNSEYWSCDRCHKYFSDSEGANEVAENSWVITKESHNMTEHPAVAATCTAGGNSEYWSCDKCKKFFSDAEGNNEIAENSWVTEKTGHDMTAYCAVAATCTADGNSAYWYCNRCKKYFSDAEGKNEIEENSWIEEKKGHNWSAGNIEKASFEKDGSLTMSCSACDAEENVKIYAVSDAQLSETAYTYDGTEKEPLVTVRDSDGNQLAPSDYDVAYTDNINAGTAKATIKLKGDRYEGSKDLEFTINAKKITPSVKLSPAAYTYDGKVKTPAVTVTYGKKTLAKGKDYDASYAASRMNAGSYKVTVKMKGNYSGSSSAAFRINKAQNPMAVNGKTVSIKYKKLKKKNQTIKCAGAMTVSKAQGKLSYKLVGVSKTKFKKYFNVGAANGNITVKKKLKKGTYKVDINVAAAGNGNYNSLTRKATVTVKVR